MDNACPLLIIGGSFDPVHNGHIDMAWHIQRLFLADNAEVEIAFMPTPLSPLKQTSTSTKHRLAMLKRALRGSPFAINRSELGMAAPVSSWDTFTLLRKAHGSRPLIFVMGQDSLNTLHTWDNGYALLQLCHIWVVGRSQHPASVPDALAAHVATHWQTLCNKPSGSIYMDGFTPTTVSSTDIRHCLSQPSAQRKTSATTDLALVPKAVLAYIKQAHLYR
jgi:nicotinate-nucleotide adenylyltransferase